MYEKEESERVRDEIDNRLPIDIILLCIITITIAGIGIELGVKYL
jgi:hypothetical protein